MTKCFLLAAVMALAACGNSTGKPTQPGAREACTEEAKVCADGSSVGRTGPNCEFAPCPEDQETITPPDPMPQPPT